MGKKKKRRPRIPVQPKSMAASTESQTYPDATVGPESDSPGTGSWYMRDSTSAPDLGQPEKPEEQYAQSEAALIDKYLFGKKLLPFAAVAILVIWIAVQDNGSGKLNNVYDLLWMGVKIIVILLFMFGVGSICQRLFKKTFE